MSWDILEVAKQSSLCPRFGTIRNSRLRFACGNLAIPLARSCLGLVHLKTAVSGEVHARCGAVYRRSSRLRLFRRVWPTGQSAPNILVIDLDIDPAVLLIAFLTRLSGAIRLR